MAGFHVVYRRTNQPIYNAVEGELQLPRSLRADRKNDTKPDKYGNYGEKNICPEFFFGMYKSINNIHYGLDAGIVYFPSGDFRLAVNMFPNTSSMKNSENEPITWFEEGLPSVYEGDIIYLEAYLVPNRICLLAKNPNTRRVIGRLYAPLSEGAFNALSKGCYINREMVMASNLLDNKYAPSRAYFSDATWRKTKVTIASSNEVIHLIDSNSSLRAPYDDHENHKEGNRPDGFLFGGYTVTEPGDFLGDYVADVGSADCRK